MRSHISLGRILGFPVDLHFTLLLLLGFTLIFGGGFSGVWLTVLVFASVLAHELGHSVVARSLGVGIEGITLYPFGGVARMRSLPERPRDEVLIAGAGPALSLLLATAFAVAFALTASELLLQLAAINAVLGLFNLIPALPMDGGRIFRALLSKRLGFLRATRIAAIVARVAAVGLAIAGLFTSGMLVIIGVVVWWMAGRELRAAEASAEGVQPGAPIDPDLAAMLRLLRQHSEAHAAAARAGASQRSGAAPEGSRASKMVVDLN